MSEEPISPERPASPPVTEPTKRRPRLDLGGGEKKRGRSMFGVLLGTLNKAKNEDKERNASEAAKKRHLIEQRLQAKLRKETEIVRRAEEAKKDKLIAVRKEEELCLKDSVYKLRYTHLPLLANFLLTSDIIPNLDDSDSTTLSSDSDNRDKEMQDVSGEDERGKEELKEKENEEKKSVAQVLKNPPRMHPPPLYYLPAKLLPSQERFLEKRKKEVQDAIEQEWSQFVQERTEGVQEIQALRQKVADVEAKSREKGAEGEEMEVDENNEKDDNRLDEKEALTNDVTAAPAKEEKKDREGEREKEKEREKDNDAMHPDDEDAVEY